MALLVGLIASSMMAADGANYMLFKLEKNFNDAHAYCVAQGGQLATWGSQSEYNQMTALFKLAGSPDSWVGLHDVGSEGKWKMIDGDTSYCDDYDGTDCDNIPQWSPNQPDDFATGQDCARMWKHHDQRLDDVSCDNAARHFICEFSSCRDMVIGDLYPAPEVPLLPEPYDPVTVPGNYFVLDFASGQQGMAFFALAASNLIWMAVAVYYCCLFKQGKATYSKVAQFSEDERLNA